MKKLILNFLYFIGFALILIQCAKLFPTDAKTIIRPATSKHNSAIAAPNKHSKLIATITDVSIDETSSQNSEK
jgi:hypothetical protein